MNILKITVVFATLVIVTTASAQYDPNHFDPNNAAHWYRKAFALHEYPNDINLYNYFFFKTELTPEIEQYLKNQQPIFELITTAVQAEYCDWEYDFFEIFEANKSPVDFYRSDAKKLSILLLSKMRFSASQDKHEEVISLFEQSLQIASHIDSNDASDHLASISIRSTIYHAILEYLNHNPDIGLHNLKLIKALLRKDSLQQTISFKDTIEKDIQITTKILTGYRTYIYPDQFLTQQIGIPVEQLSEDFYKRNLSFYTNYMRERQAYLCLAYPEAHQSMINQNKTLDTIARNYFAAYNAQIKSRVEKYEKMFSQKDDIDMMEITKLRPSFLAEVNIEQLEKCDFLYTLLCVIHKPSFYLIDTSIPTKRNALETGISVLIHYRKTGKLLDKIPLSCPNDLFSNKPFLITETQNGFKLKCQGEDFSLERKFHEFEFILPDGKSKTPYDI